MEAKISINSTALLRIPHQVDNPCHHAPPNCITARLKVTIIVVKNGIVGPS